MYFSYVVSIIAILEFEVCIQFAILIRDVTCVSINNQSAVETSHVLAAFPPFMPSTINMLCSCLSLFVEIEKRRRSLKKANRELYFVTFKYSS